MPQLKPNISNEQVDIKEFPTSIGLDSGNTITLGDMHGNVMKLMWALIRQGVIQMKKKDFDRAWEIYEQQWKNENRKSSLNLEAAQKFNTEFQQILSRVKVTPGKQVRLLGDVIADRGNNDLFTINLLKKLRVGGVKTEIIASNHDLFLLSNYQKDPENWVIKAHTERNTFFKNSKLMIENGIITHEEFKKLIDEEYLSNFKLISYDLSADGQKIDLFMHAPNSYSVIKDLAIALGVAEQGIEIKNASQLAKIIDDVNFKFQLLRFQDRSRFEEMMEAAVQDESLNGDHAALARLIWRYDTDEQKKWPGPEADPDFIRKINHGHIGEGKQVNSSQENLDCDIGKSEQVTEGVFKVRCAEEKWHGFSPEQQQELDNAKKIREEAVGVVVGFVTGTATTIDDVKKIFNRLATDNPREFSKLKLGLEKAKALDVEYLAADTEIYEKILHANEESPLLWGPDCDELIKALAEAQEKAKTITAAIDVAKKIAADFLASTKIGPAKSSDHNENELISEASRLCAVYINAAGKDQNTSKVLEQIKIVLDSKSKPFSQKIATMKTIIDDAGVAMIMNSTSIGQKFLNFFKNIFTGNFKAAFTSAEKIHETFKNQLANVQPVELEDSYEGKNEITADPEIKKLMDELRKNGLAEYLRGKADNELLMEIIEAKKYSEIVLIFDQNTLNSAKKNEESIGIVAAIKERYAKIGYEQIVNGYYEEDKKDSQPPKINLSTAPNISKKQAVNVDLSSVTDERAEIKGQNPRWTTHSTLAGLLAEFKSLVTASMPNQRQRSATLSQMGVKQIEDAILNIYTNHQVKPMREEELQDQICLVAQNNSSALKILEQSKGDIDVKLTEIFAMAKSRKIARETSETRLQADRLILEFKELLTNATGYDDRETEKKMAILLEEKLESLAQENPKGFLALKNSPGYMDKYFPAVNDKDGGVDMRLNVIATLLKAGVGQQAEKAARDELIAKQQQPLIEIKIESSESQQQCCR